MEGRGARARRGRPTAGDALIFLIVGAGRGGTSLLAALLDAHPDLEIGMEHASVACLMGKSLPVGSQSGDPSHLAYDRIAAFLACCTEEVRRHPGKRWGNKITTEQLSGLEDHNEVNRARPINVFEVFFDDALAAVPVVFILRDGRTCVRSKMARTGQPLETACARWRYSVRVLDHLRSRHREFHWLRYEDLVREPEVTLGGLCCFLGVHYDERMLRGTSTTKLRPEYRRDSIDPGTLGLEGVPEGCVPLIEGDLRRYGYVP
jgi:hypothetical protein